MVQAGRIKLTYCASEDMVADMFTKGLPIKEFEKLRQMAGIAELTRWEWEGVLVINIALSASTVLFIIM